MHTHTGCLICTSFYEVMNRISTCEPLPNLPLLVAKTFHHALHPKNLDWTNLSPNLSEHCLEHRTILNCWDLLPLQWLLFERFVPVLPSWVRCSWWWWTWWNWDENCLLMESRTTTTRRRRRRRRTQGPISWLSFSLAGIFSSFLSFFF